MSEADKSDGSVKRPAGSVSLTKYLAHGGGIELFRAYVDRRNADQQANLKRKAEIIEALNANTGVPFDVFDRLTSELTMLQILEELDPVINDLRRFCANSGPGNDQLPNLRSALRIGDGRAPSDSETHERKWAVQQRWIDAYLAMQESGDHRSQNDIAKDIAKEFGVSTRKVIGDWAEKKLAEPWQATWALGIETRAKIRQQREVRQPSKSKAPKRQRRITFGRGM